MRRILGVLVMALIGTMVLLASPNEQTSELQLQILQSRQDMEFLANEVFGEGVRPENWTLNADLQSSTIAADLWFDNEQLADEVFGAGQRPADWFGATSRSADLIVRNVRHDLELTADEVFGGTDRPRTWNAGRALYRCSRTIQNTIFLLSVIYNLQSSTPENVDNYCDIVAREISGEMLPLAFISEPAATAGLPEQIVALRGDLERLANEVLGVNNRPGGWIGYIEGSDSLLADATRDLNELATLALESTQRPPDWQPSLSVSDAVLYRNQRYNLELLANIVLAGGRPGGWQGNDPLERCLPLDQGFVFMVQNNYQFTIDDALAGSGNFCELVTFTANSVLENPDTAEIVQAEDTRYMGRSEYAFTYLDSAATQYMGIMPLGTEFRAWYRNFNESTMMFVSGENFALYIDLRWTTFDQEIFNTLPTLEGVIPLAFCDANWCNGPGPTPTPTGSGPLELLLMAATAQPTIDPGSVGRDDGGLKTQVSWNHVRVTYLLDRPETGTAQVALEICAEPQQITCEPVISVFDNNLGAAKPVLSQFNGLNVYEFRYGYNSNVIIEGTNYVSPDIWISDPTIR